MPAACMAEKWVRTLFCCRFHAWPEEALVSVAERFLVDVPALSDELRSSIAQHMAFANQAVTAASHK